VRQPRLLDLFCGAGGAAMGYARAGFEVVGVDIKPQPHYPFAFHQADALEFLEDLDYGPEGAIFTDRTLVDFAAIHASPPCQAHSAMKVMWNAREHPDLVPEVRDLLNATDLPYVIENVVGAPLVNPVTICGAGLGLGLDTHDLARHRLFECSFPVMVPPCAHGSMPVLGVYGDHARDRRRSTSIGNGQYGAKLGLEMAREAMGIDWMNWREISQAIPPAYTEHIGSYLLAEVNRRNEVAA
jgi:DNA (cytosine-5)-methyltransferase 1